MRCLLERALNWGPALNRKNTVLHFISKYKQQLLFIIHSLNLFKNKLVWIVHALAYCRVDPNHVISNESSSLRKSWDTSNNLKHTDIKIIQNNFPFVRRPSSFSFFPHPDFPEKTCKNSKWREIGEQLRMLGLPGYLLNNLISLSLNSYLALIFATKRWCNGIKWL